MDVSDRGKMKIGTRGFQMSLKALLGSFGLSLLVCLTCLSCAKGDDVASIRDLIRLKLELKNADDWVVSRAIFERFTGLGFEG